MKAPLVLLLGSLPLFAAAQEPVFSPEDGFQTILAFGTDHLLVRNNEVDFACTLYSDGHSVTIHSCVPIRYVETAPLTIQSLAAVPHQDIRAFVIDMIRANNCVLDISDPEAMEQEVVTEIARRLGQTVPLSISVQRAIGDTFEEAFQGQNVEELFLVDEELGTLTLEDC